ncbi:hypothetical protein JHK82_043649 [Glycine max]|nr:hypothetical protein JHK86_043535 [Glycine max]KAG5106679.1 hypothetical protein JHK82_043649 [Glycine max]
MSMVVPIELGGVVPLINRFQGTSRERIEGGSKQYCPSNVAMGLSVTTKKKTKNQRKTKWRRKKQRKKKKKEEEKKPQESKDDKESKEESTPPDIVLKVFMHCEGCACKVVPIAVYMTLGFAFYVFFAPFLGKKISIYDYGLFRAATLLLPCITLPVWVDGLNNSKLGGKSTSSMQHMMEMLELLDQNRLIRKNWDVLYHLLYPLVLPYGTRNKCS